VGKSPVYTVRHIIAKIRGREYILGSCPFVHVDSFVPLCGHPEHVNDLPRKVCHYDAFSQVHPPPGCPLLRFEESAILSCSD
jgi:hypothetical protein